MMIVKSAELFHSALQIFFVWQYKEKSFFSLYFAQFALPLTSSKVLLFDNKKKNSFFFCIVLTYSYL